MTNNNKYTIYVIHNYRNRSPKRIINNNDLTYNLINNKRDYIKYMYNNTVYDVSVIKETGYLRYQSILYLYKLKNVIINYIFHFYNIFFY